MNDIKKMLKDAKALVADELRKGKDLKRRCRAVLKDDPVVLQWSRSLARAENHIKEYERLAKLLSNKSLVTAFDHEKSYFPKDNIHPMVNRYPGGPSCFFTDLFVFLTAVYNDSKPDVVDRTYVSISLMYHRGVKNDRN